MAHHVRVQARQAAALILERLGGEGELEQCDGKWELRCPTVHTDSGDVALTIELKDWQGIGGAKGLDLDGIVATPHGG
jgi:hypothetical protein